MKLHLTYFELIWKILCWFDVCQSEKSAERHMPHIYIIIIIIITIISDLLLCISLLPTPQSLIPEFDIFVVMCLFHPSSYDESIGRILCV